MLAANVSPWRAGTGDAFFRFDIRVETFLVQCQRRGFGILKTYFEEVGIVSWTKRCRGEVPKGFVGSGRVVVWRVYLLLLYILH